MPTLQQQLYYDSKVRTGNFIQPFEIPLTNQNIIIRSDSTDETFFTSTIIPLNLINQSYVPGEPLDLTKGEYCYINSDFNEYKLFIQPASWLTNLSITIWQGFPDNPDPIPHDHNNLETLGRISEQDNKLYFRNQIVCNHSHGNLATISKISESDDKLYWLGEPIPNHIHDNLTVLIQLSEQNEKLYFNGNLVSELNHNHSNQLVLDELSANNGILLFYGEPVAENLHTHDNFNVLAKFSENAGQLLYNNVSIQSDMTEVLTAIINAQTLLATKLDIIQETVNNISNQPSSGLMFTLLPIAPTYETKSSHGWMVAPTNLDNIHDGNVSTSTNEFEVGGMAWIWGEVILNPNVTIPQYSRLSITVGLKSVMDNTRPAFELAVLRDDGVWVQFWGFFGIPLSNTTELMQTIDNMFKFPWSKVRFRIWDVGYYPARATIKDFKLWEVT